MNLFFPANPFRIKIFSWAKPLKFYFFLGEASQIFFSWIVPLKIYFFPGECLSKFIFSWRVPLKIYHFPEKGLRHFIFSISSGPTPRSLMVVPLGAIQKLYNTTAQAGREVRSSVTICYWCVSWSSLANRLTPSRVPETSTFKPPTPGWEITEFPGFRDTQKHCRKPNFLTRVSDWTPCRHQDFRKPKVLKDFPLPFGKRERVSETQVLGMGKPNNFLAHHAKFPPVQLCTVGSSVLWTWPKREKIINNT